MPCSDAKPTIPTLPGGTTMKEVKVLGTGCSNCKATARLVEDVARSRGAAIALEKVEDLRAIMAFNILATPGVVIDGRLVHAGGVPSREKVESWFPVGSRPSAG